MLNCRLSWRAVHAGSQASLDLGLRRYNVSWRAFRAGLSGQAELQLHLDPTRLRCLHHTVLPLRAILIWKSCLMVLRDWRQRRRLARALVGALIGQLCGRNWFPRVSPLCCESAGLLRLAVGDVISTLIMLRLSYHCWLSDTAVARLLRHCTYQI